jgi:hypothetical protein
VRNVAVRVGWRVCEQVVLDREVSGRFVAEGRRLPLGDDGRNLTVGSLDGRATSDRQAQSRR